MENQKQRVYDALDKLGIKYEVVEHEPVHTMEDMDRLGLPEKGTLCKNLFLRDSKGKRHFLVTADETQNDLVVCVISERIGTVFFDKKFLSRGRIDTGGTYRPDGCGASAVIITRCPGQ